MKTWWFIDVYRRSLSTQPVLDKGKSCQKYLGWVCELLETQILQYISLRNHYLIVYPMEKNNVDYIYIRLFALGKQGDRPLRKHQPLSIPGPHGHSSLVWFPGVSFLGEAGNHWYIWVDYNDRTLELWLICGKSSPFMAELFRLVNYYNLPRYIVILE